VYAVALLRARLYPVLVSSFALLPGTGCAAAGVVMAYSGFSELAMSISMPAGLLLLIWMLGIGVWMWQCK